MITLRMMAEADLPVVGVWMRQPHVAGWWLEGSTLEKEFDDCARSVRGKPTNILVVLEDDRPIGWCQWYRYADYPDDAPAIGASLDEIGIDYAIGEQHAIGRGLGTLIIAALVEEVRNELPDARFIVDPSAPNLPSRSVLEQTASPLSRNAWRLDGVLEAIYRSERPRKLPDRGVSAGRCRELPSPLFGAGQLAVEKRTS